MAFDTAQQIAWAEAELAAGIAAFEGPPGFRLANSYYESVDAEICDALVRRLAPSRVIELGSGWSTLLLRAAAPGRVTTYDPYPAEFLDGVERRAAQDIPLEVFDGLRAGDVLFVDTSHTVKLGGEVVHLFLEVLPRLAPGVVVHVHDIALPYEYDRRYVVDLQMPWAEQYLLQALLCGSLDWEVLFGAQAVARKHPARLRAIVPSLRDRHYPSSFWMRRDQP